MNFANHFNTWINWEVNKIKFIFFLITTVTNLVVAILLMNLKMHLKTNKYFKFIKNFINYL